MTYYTEVYQNDRAIEVRISRDPRGVVEYISIEKIPNIVEGKFSGVLPAAIWINATFPGSVDIDEIHSIQRWLGEAAKIARLLDDRVTTLADFTEAKYKVVSAVAGTLMLDKEDER